MTARDGERGAVTTDASGGDVLSAMRVVLEKVARPFREAGRNLDTLMAEAAPFAESARRALDEAPEDERAPAWREARSFAWLLAYRLGDQGWPAHVAAAVMPAWRDAVGRDRTLQHADELQALVVEAFARGREDRARTEAQRGLAEALPVTEVAPHVVVIVAAGALDPDGASALADRASSYLLRRDAKAALLDIAGLVSPTAAVLAELWSIPSAARMLGVRMVVSGVTGYVGEAVRAANLHDEGERRFALMSEGVEALLREAGVSLGRHRGVAAWFRGFLARRE